MEYCKNPWNKDCKNQNIEVYIMFEGEKHAICKNCWTEIAEKEVEW